MPCAVPPFARRGCWREKDQVTMNYEAASYRPLLAVGDIRGEGDKGVVELVA